MSDSLFYCDIESDSKISGLVSAFREYSQKESKQVYIIKKALGTTNDYDYNDEAIILVPKHKVVIIDYGVNYNERFENFLEDFTEDLGYLSKKFDYKRILGRPREWQELITSKKFDESIADNITNFLKNNAVKAADERKVDLLISLLIGSINDIEKLGVEDPETLLDKVKNKIILFDGMQSRFIYEKVDKPQIIIQGLAGTGKTELLLHKLRETYVKNEDSRIAFTCFNKVLAKDMKNRIPGFFNFMRVEEQIEWDRRLWVFSSWGSQSIPNSGLYSYICSRYGLEFKRFSYTNTLDKVCKDACEQLKSIDNFEPCFDYTFIDESQDFSQSFFDLCSLVTKVKIYIAGDIFQNIFDMNVKSSVECDYLLNKCYRTDPKTLMFAHSIGMGLYEKPVIRWLEDEEWENCGYEYKRENGEFILSRKPIRRFEDVDSINSIQLRECSIDCFTEKILTCIDEIRKNNSTVFPDDIAIVFVGNTKINYKIADSLAIEINKKYNWETNMGYITKTKSENQLFISNTNNIKGLEFPFIICVETNKITDNIHQRNSIYMVLTRSFLTSYFIVNDDNGEFIKTYKHAIYNINKDGFMKLREPSEKEKEEQEEKIRIMAQAKKKSVEDIIDEICKKQSPKLTHKQKKVLYDTIPNIIKNESEEEVIARTKAMIKVILGD